jgi:pyoverdine/dityrosine biosynthesis protein Dit1
MSLNVKSESKKEGAAVIQWDASGDHENQQWSLVKRGNFYKIKARHSEMFLDVAEKRKHPVVQFPARKSNENQLFELVPDKGKQ